LALDKALGAIGFFKPGKMHMERKERLDGWMVGVMEERRPGHLCGVERDGRLVRGKLLPVLRP
jgi:hypothetical protein